MAKFIIIFLIIIISIFALIYGERREMEILSIEFNDVYTMTEEEGNIHNLNGMLVYNIDVNAGIGGYGNNEIRSTPGTHRVTVN